MFDTCFGVCSFQTTTTIWSCRFVFWNKYDVYEVVSPRTLAYWDLCGEFVN